MSKIRIFALAKELGLDNKTLIEYCNKAGVQVKSSALASITPEERDTVVNYIQQESAAGSEEPDQEAMKPTREQTAATKGKVRKIKSTAPRTQTTRAKKKEEPAETTAAEAEEPGAQPAAEEARKPPAAEQPESPQPAEPAASTEAETQEGASAESETSEEGSDQDGKKAEPISREDYVPAPGATGSRIREMKPIGTVPESESRYGRQSKGKSKTSTPNIAAPPEYKPPRRKKPEKSKETPAQKPDLKLTADALEGQSPLSAHLRKHAEQKKKKKGGQEETSDLKEAARRSKLGAEARQRRDKRPRRVRDEEAPGRTMHRRRQKSGSQAPLKTSAQIEPPITVRGLSEAMGRPAKTLLSILFKQGKMVTINEVIDVDTALELALELGVDLDVKHERDIEAELAEALESEDSEEKLVERPPVVTILGHVDHGKTTLLDKIRSTNVVGGEAGGITQHIAAYQIDHDGRKITFVDTPGHEAFGEMRARGANVTDIIVLVVAADDGVMPQTVECISHARSTGAPIVVAMNKIDRPDTDEQKILADLASHDVLPAEWGGDVEVVRTSATTGQGIDELIETIQLTAELQELKVNPDRPALGVCLEGYRDEGLGTLAWLIVQKGTLRVGDVVLCGPSHGRVRSMYNDRDEPIEEAGPTMPVKVAGLDVVPGAGDHFFVMSDLEEARETAERRRERGRAEVLAGRGKPRTLDDILDAARGGTMQDLPLILKADTPGSIEALRHEIEKLEHPEVRVDIIHENVGGVNESDVYLASASGAIIIAFHVIPEDRAQVLAEREGVDIRRYSVIYEVTDHIKNQLEGMLEPERVEVPTGRALVLQTFNISRYGRIAGCRVLSGTISRNNRVHVIRDQTVLNDYNIASIRREKDDVKEVREGMECGIRVEGFNDVKEGDLLEAFRIDEVKRSLDSEVERREAKVES